MISEKDFFSALLSELNEKIAGGRIEKIQQPAKDILVFLVRKESEKIRLLISAGNGKARVHITKAIFENPMNPPMFCMLLRKHLSGSEIMSFNQYNDDKVIGIKLKNNDELGRTAENTLFCELINRVPNIVLVDINDTIVDCLYKRDYDSEMYRRLFPGMKYKIPKKPYEYIERESVFRLDSPSSSLDMYFLEKEKKDIFSSKSREIRSVLKNAIKRTERKLGKRKNEMLQTCKKNEIKQSADLINANIWRIKKGDKYVECEDYFNGGKSVLIELDPKKTPQLNAALLYKEYKKLKSAEEYLSKLIEDAEVQLDFLNSCLYELSCSSTDSEIEEIKQELAETGYLRSKKIVTIKNKPKKYQPSIYSVSPSGYEILCGKNNIQNEKITFNCASKDDYWFHARSFHGSHVILRSGAELPTEDDIYAAATVAAENSQAAGNCIVDYCQVKYVKKAPGALPGRVVFRNNKSIKITKEKEH